MSQGRRRLWRPVLAAAGAALLVAIVGGLATDIGPWYQALNKPSWQPPDWLFGPVWTVIYALAALAGVIAWRHAQRGAERHRIIVLFALNAALNVLWSWLFFGWHRPDLALAEVGFLWLSILALILALGRIAPAAGWLLVPYLLWVSFAAFLNYTIVQLNAPFSGA